MNRQQTRFGRHACAALALLLAATTAGAGVFNVPADYPTIQDAIDAAGKYDEVIIAPGTYFEHDIDFQGKVITVRGSDPLDPAVVDATVIDAQGEGRLFKFDSNEQIFSILAGVTLTGGSAVIGGAIKVERAAPTIENVDIVGNTAQKGGGIYCLGPANGNLILRNVTVSDNEATGVPEGISNLSPAMTEALRGMGAEAFEFTTATGGGIQAVDGCSPLIFDSTITDNTAGLGGGIAMRFSDAQIESTTFSGNDARWAGAIYFRESPEATLTDSLITGNVAEFGGGGIGIENASIAMRGLVISGNTGNFGGGLGLSNADPTCTNCLIHDNVAFTDGGAAAIFNGAGPLFLHNTISRNSAVRGGGLYVDSQSSVTVLNSILWDDVPNEIETTGGTLTVDYSDVQGGFPGTGNIDADPLFANPAGGDFHLLAGSPAIDAAFADDGADDDFEGEVRPGGLEFDMGADEYFGPPTTHQVPGDFATIQAAIDAALNGDTIVVAPGTYSEHDIDFKRKALTVTGTDPDDPSVVAATVVDGGGLSSVFLFQSGEAGSSVLRGLTITGGLAASGGGVFILASSPTLDRVVVTGNQAVEGHGGGVFSDGGAPTLVDSTVSNNSASGTCVDLTLCGSGGGFFGINGAPVVVDSTFDGNSAQNRGGGIWQFSGVLENVTVTGNSADQGGGVYAREVPVDDSLIGTGNTATTEGGGIYIDTGRVRNSTIQGNSAQLGGGVAVVKSLLIDSTVTGNHATSDGGGAWRGELVNVVVQNNTSDNDGGGVADCDLVKESLILDNTATLRGGGSSNTQQLTSTEVRGNSAETGGGVFLQNALADEAAVQDCLITENTAVFGGGAAVKTPWPFPIWADPVAAKFRTTDFLTNQASDSGGAFHCDECVARITDSMLSGNAADVRGGGIYVTPTLLDIAKPRLVVEFTSVDNNTAASDAGALWASTDAVVEMLDSDVTANQALGGDGGAFYIAEGADVEIIRTEIWDNAAPIGDGGALYGDIASEPEMINCNVWSNTAVMGAAIFSNSSHIRVVNSTITKNTATEEGGGLVTSSSFTPEEVPKLVNTILWGDTPEEVIVLGQGIPRIEHSVVQGGWPDVGNMEVDPLFVDPDNDDFHLQPTSPAIDAADDGMAPSSDLDGDPRPFGADSDIGADEFFIANDPGTPEDERAPVVDSISPVKGTVAGGDLVTITGSNFGTFTEVFFGDSFFGSVAEIVSLTETSIEVISPQGSNIGPIDITVTNFQSWSDVLSDGWEYLLPDNPLISSVVPNTGSVTGFDINGDPEFVTINGSSFLPPMKVFFGTNQSSNVTVVSESEMTVRVPAAAAPGAVDVVVENPYVQTDVLVNGFTYVLPAPPIVSTITPSSGTVSGGLPVTITGDLFTPLTTVTIGGNPATDVVYVSAQELTAVTPPSAVTGPVDVAAIDEWGQSGILAGGFEYLGLVDPAITMLDPNVGSTSGGEPVNIIGVGFDETIELFVDGLATVVMFIDSETLMYISPAHAVGDGCTDIDVEVKVVRGDSKEATATFTYQPEQVVNVGPGESIQAAVNAAGNGACILLAENPYPGYQETVLVTDRVLGIFGADSSAPWKTVINGGGGSQFIMRFVDNPPGTVLRGVSLVEGNGGLWVSGADLVAEDLVIQNNDRSGDGGGILVDAAGHAVLRRSTISLNTASDDGGGVSVSGSATLELEDNVIALNEAADFGGGIHVDVNGPFSITGNRIEFNTAGERGGGVYGGADSDITLDGVEIVGNLSEITGGGVHVGNDSALTAIDCTIDLNQAEADAGGIYVNLRGSLTMTGGSVSANLAMGSGGGIAVEDESSVDIDGVTFADNMSTTTSGTGGAIVLDQFVNGQIVNSRITGNTAQIGGAIFLAAKTDVLVERNEIACNSAVQNGDDPPTDPPFYAPAVFSTDSQSSFVNNTLWGNTGISAGVDSGALHIEAPFLFPEVVSNILADNDGYGLYCSPGSSLSRVEYNLFWNNSAGDTLNCDPGAGSVFEDPLLVDPVCPDPDLTLQAGSPAIDAGDPLAPVPPGGGTRVDIGANEFPQ